MSVAHQLYFGPLIPQRDLGGFVSPFHLCTGAPLRFAPFHL